MTTTKQPIDREEIARHRTQVQAHPESPDHLREAVRYFIEAGLPHDAYDPMKKLVQLQPRDTSLQLLWGAVCVELGRTDQAEQVFIEIIRREPQSTIGYHNLGVLYVATDQVEKAIEQFNSILRLEPENIEALNDLAVLYASSGHESQAESTYERCLTSAPDYRKCWQNALRFAYSTGRFAKGRQWVTHLAAMNPADPELTEWRRKFAQAGYEATDRNSDMEIRGRTAQSTVAEQPGSPGAGLVSVIIPTYNDSKLIVETIESILDQTYSNIEIIVVDDGSTDDTEAALKPFRPKITYVPRVHEGWAAAANDGIQNSNGTWILAVSPGDVLQPQAIEKQAVFLTAHPTHDAVRTSDSLVLSDITSDETAGHADSSVDSGSTTSVLPMFRREAFTGTGFFDETGEDDGGAWARWMMVTKFARCCRVGALDEPLLSLSTAHREPFKEDQYRAKIAGRWHAEIETSPGTVQPVHDPTIKTAKKTGLSVLIISADDLGGMFSSMASAINKYTPHDCRVLVHQSSGIHESQILLKLPREQHEIAEVDTQARQWAKDADQLIFAAGIAPGAMRRDCRLEDTDELLFGRLDWREYSTRKKCTAFLCSSPSVRGNYRWYHQRFAGRGWTVITASPDIYLNVPDSHFVPPMLDLSVKEYTRPEFSIDSMAVVYNQRPAYAAGGEEMLVPVAHRIREKYGRRVLFGRCVDMTLPQVLVHRHGAHIGFDRISLGAPRFGLTSLENSALGLANIVYLDQFARSLLARTLGTDELPWFSPDSVDALYDTIDRLVADPDGLQKTMIQTAEWFRRWWTAENMIRHLIRVLEG